MPFDAVFLTAVAQELRQGAQGAKVDKVYQPARDPGDSAITHPGRQSKAAAVGQLQHSPGSVHRGTL